MLPAGSAADQLDPAGFFFSGIACRFLPMGRINARNLLGLVHVTQAGLERPERDKR